MLIFVAKCMISYFMDGICGRILCMICFLMFVYDFICFYLRIIILYAIGAIFCDFESYTNAILVIASCSKS